jgi:hypothetical protein
VADAVSDVRDATEEEEAMDSLLLWAMTEPARARSEREKMDFIVVRKDCGAKECAELDVE